VVAVPLMDGATDTNSTPLVQLVMRVLRVPPELPELPLVLPVAQVGKHPFVQVLVQESVKASVQVSLLPWHPLASWSVAWLGEGSEQVSVQELAEELALGVVLVQVSVQQLVKELVSVQVFFPPWHPWWVAWLGQRSGQALRVLQELENR
jgi:hypothetical protein